MYRGKCKFEDKVQNAAFNGAVGIVVVNDQPEEVITMSIGGLNVLHLFFANLYLRRERF